MADKCDVKPFPVPGNGCDVSPMKEGELLHMSDSERSLFDSFTGEQTQISGTSVDYWVIDAEGTKTDPLYGEAIEREFSGPFKFMGSFRAPDVSDFMSEEGIATIFDGSCVIPRKSFEDASAGHPGPGDVLRVWNLPMYMALATPEAVPVEGSGYFFDVMNVNPDGYVADSPTFMRYSMKIKRRTVFTPERRLNRP